MIKRTGLSPTSTLPGISHRSYLPPPSAAVRRNRDANVIGHDDSMGDMLGCWEWCIETTTTMAWWRGGFSTSWYVFTCITHVSILTYLTPNADTHRRGKKTPRCHIQFFEGSIPPLSLLFASDPFHFDTRRGLTLFTPNLSLVDVARRGKPLYFS